MNKSGTGDDMVGKKTVILAIILVIVASLGCVGKEPTAQETTATSEESSEKSKSTTAPSATEASTTEKVAPVVEEGIITDKLIYDNPDMKGEVRKNKLTKKAEVETLLYFNDSEEWGEGFFEGEQMTTVPFIVNTLCNIYTLIYFNETGLKEWQEAGNFTVEDTEEHAFLEGYTVTDAAVIFKDKETDEKIAECTATGPTWDDIVFNAYRDYPVENSLMEAEIGKKQS